MAKTASKEATEKIARLFGSMTLAAANLEASIDTFAVLCKDMKLDGLYEVAERFAFNIGTKGRFVRDVANLSPINELDEVEWFNSPEFNENYSSFVSVRHWIMHGRLVSFSPTHFNMGRMLRPEDRKVDGKKTQVVTWSMRTISRVSVLESIEFAHETRMNVDRLEKKCWKYLVGWPSLAHADAQVVVDPRMLAA